MNQHATTSQRLPAIFIGHGSPMLAIEDNPFTPKWLELAQSFAKPKAILCISAHWVAEDVRLTASTKPELIYDFGGFPEALYQIQYPAPGSPELATKVQSLLGKDKVVLDEHRGFDHGLWCVCREMYPDADVPIVEMSLSAALSLEQHVELAGHLKSLRDDGVLILATGNLIHNLRELDWKRANEVGYGYDWAKDAQKELLQWIQDGDCQKLLTYYQGGDAINLAIPSADHYVPLLYILAQKESGDTLSIFNDDFVGGSLDMTSVVLMPE